MSDEKIYQLHGGEERSNLRKAARGATGKSGALPDASTRKDWMTARRAVAMHIGKREPTPYRSRAVPTMTEEHEQWVREHPATAEDIIGYLSDFATAKNLKLMISYGITIEQLIVPAADNMRLLIETVRGWAERSAWRLEPFVREGKPGLTSAYADLHVITYAADRWLDRYEEQDFVIQ